MDTVVLALELRSLLCLKRQCQPIIDGICTTKPSYGEYVAGYQSRLERQRNSHVKTAGPDRAAFRREENRHRPCRSVRT